MEKLADIINETFANIDNADISPNNTNLATAVNEVIRQLNDGEIRVAEKTQGNWHIHQWVKKAVLLSFRLNSNRLISTPLTNYYDKVPLKFSHYTEQDFQNCGARIVPPATVRSGAYIAPNVVVMPSYINIGAYVDSGSMVDTWATIGACAQIGKNVHLSGGAGIGGVLEPLQANPTIIEDNCFIGARSEIVEGVIVEENSVISMGVFISQSTPIYDREKDEIIYGKIPAGSVVVPGSLPGKNNKHSLYAAIIVKQVDEKTRSKTSINALLREATSHE